MQEENKTEKSKKGKTEEKATEKTKLVLGKGQVAMLSVSATVLIFIMAFSCYGCSYQPITPPTPEEARTTFDNLYNSTWVLDTTVGTPTLIEFSDMAIMQLDIEQKRAESEGANTTIHISGTSPVQADLTYQEGYGFVLSAGDVTFPVKLSYSVSKDGKSETLTMIGNESNTHCYYLKK